MNLQVAAHQVEGYRVNTPVYEGPLDLLLQLIERAELDITTLALAQVTDQYLAHLKEMQRANAAASSGGNGPACGDAAASSGGNGPACGDAAASSGRNGPACGDAAASS